MPRRSRPRWLAALRLGVLLVFALGMLAQQALGTVGELHEFTAHAASATAHTDHFTPHRHDAAVPDTDERDARDPAHLLLHYAHCCGHNAGMQGAEPPQLAMRAPPAERPAAVTPAVPPSRVATPFRPPILA